MTTKYMPVSFNNSFQEWAQTNKLACSCGGSARIEPQNHKEGCSMVVAFVHWQESGKQLYATFPKAPPTDFGS